jgi:hypothetical protein
LTSRTPDYRSRSGPPPFHGSSIELCLRFDFADRIGLRTHITRVGVAVIGNRKWVSDRFYIELGIRACHASSAHRRHSKWGHSLHVFSDVWPERPHRVLPTRRPHESGYCLVVVANAGYINLRGTQLRQVVDVSCLPQRERSFRRGGYSASASRSRSL